MQVRYMSRLRPADEPGQRSAAAGMEPRRRLSAVAGQAVEQVVPFRVKPVGAALLPVCVAW